MGPRRFEDDGRPKPRNAGEVGFFRRHWNGDYSLARSYWVNTFLISFVAPAVGLMLFPAVADKPARYSSGAVLFVTLLGYAAFVWAARGTWASASNHQRAGGKYARLARAAIVLGAVRSGGALLQMREGLAEHVAVLFGRQAGPAYTIQISPDGRSIAVKGGINEGAALALRRALDLAPRVRTISFESGGGWVREGGLIADLIRQRQLATHVERECSSACTLAFLGGHERSIAARARLGFHQARSVGSSIEEREYDVKTTRSVYAKAGLLPDFIEKVVATPPDGMWYPTTSQLLASRVVTTTHEWDSSRAELMTKQRQTLTTNLGDMKLSESEIQALLECEVDEQIQWLNTTGCSYFYEIDKRSREEHLREQDACVLAAGGDARYAAIDLACSKRHIPNDWSIFEDILAKSFAASIDPQHPDSETARQLGRCMSLEYLEAVKATDCKPLDTSATTAEGLFSSETCLQPHKPRIERHMLRVARTCSSRVRSDQGSAK